MDMVAVEGKSYRRSKEESIFFKKRKGFPEHSFSTNLNWSLRLVCEPTRYSGGGGYQGGGSYGGG